MKLIEVTVEKRLKFPSPIGELHFSIRGDERYVTEEQFPSPIGELHFSIESAVAFRGTSNNFRPLSGSYISQSVVSFTSVNLHQAKNFRPLSGSYISQ